MRQWGKIISDEHAYIFHKIFMITSPDPTMNSKFIFHKLLAQSALTKLDCFDKEIIKK